MKKTDISEEILAENNQEAEEKKVKNTSEITRLMEDVVKTSPLPPEEGALVEGVVVAKDKMSLFVDVPPFGTGIIYGREYLNARDIIKKINIGDAVSAKIITPDGESGYMELSLKEAKQAVIWSEADKAMKNKTTYELNVKDANKGGLILEWQGTDGFIPTSQLKPEHYPRVEDGNKDKIVEELRKLVGTKLTVSVIGADPKEGKLIFSEKALDSKARREVVSKYNVGDTVEGEVTGAVDFGIFIKLEEGLEGLVHISEVDWSLVENLKERYHVGEKVKARIIEVKDGKISLSIKALKDNPWKEAEKKYEAGTVVKGVVIKFNKHGALVSVEEGVAGLVHISEFKSEDELRSKLELGKTYTFTINIFDPKEQKMTLSFGEGKKEEK